MMRRAILSILCFLLASCTLLPRSGTPEQPIELSGVLQGTTVVRGYVLVAADLLVPSGSKLVIRPGTTVLVRDSESTKIDPEYLSPQTEILIRGDLVVEGRSDAMISFLPEKPAMAGEVGWAGIIINGSTDSVIRYASITQAETGILVVNASPDIIGSRISQARYGIVVQGGTARILDNEITRGEGGIFCWNQARPYLKDNLIVANDEEGVVVDHGSRPYLDRNVISGNGIGLVVPQGLPYDPTMISGNREDVRVLVDRKGGSQ